MLWIAVVCAAAFGLVLGWFTGALSERLCGLTLRLPRWAAAVVTAAVIALMVVGVGISWVLPAFLWLAAIGSVLCLIDLEHKRLPDVLNLPAFGGTAVLLLLPATLDGRWDLYLRGWLGALALLLFYGILFVIYPAGMGFGDVKLSATLGMALGYLGWSYVIVGAFAGFFLGAIVGIALMIFGGAGRKTRVPFGPFMLAGALVAVLFAADLTNWYLRAAIS